jgi:hypothetical protein
VGLFAVGAAVVRPPRVVADAAAVLVLPAAVVSVLGLFVLGCMEVWSGMRWIVAVIGGAP